jgi:hypothetical protein
MTYRGGEQEAARQHTQAQNIGAKEQCPATVPTVWLLLSAGQTHSAQATKELLKRKCPADVLDIPITKGSNESALHRGQRAMGLKRNCSHLWGTKASKTLYMLMPNTPKRGESEVKDFREAVMSHFLSDWKRGCGILRALITHHVTNQEASITSMRLSGACRNQILNWQSTPPGLVLTRYPYEPCLYDLFSSLLLCSTTMGPLHHLSEISHFRCCHRQGPISAS